MQSDLLFLAATRKVVDEFGATERPARITITTATGLKIRVDVPPGWRPPARHNPADGPTHSPDFRSVNWFGESYLFTGKQAAGIKVLWDAWEAGSPDVGQHALLEAMDSEQGRLDHIFRSEGRPHPAWGKLIVRSSPGVYRLQEPGVAFQASNVVADE
jgi:hypothetical protein